MRLRTPISIVVLVAACGVVIFGAHVRSEEPGSGKGAQGREEPAEAEPPLPLFSKDLKVFMDAKLEHSQKLLKGLTLQDFKAIKKEAQELSLLSRASTWQVLQTEDYIQHSREFRRAADDIRAAAEKNNLDGAALAYVDMTMSCVRCHKYVRGVKMADLGLPHKARTPR